MLPFPSRSLRFFGLSSVRVFLRAARLGALAESLPLAEGLGDPAGFDLVAGLFDVRAFDGVALRLSEGRDDGEDEYDENGGEGDEGVDVRHEFEPSLPVAGLDEELEADEREDRGEPVVEVDEPFEEPFDEEEELAQSHEREGVGGEDDERLGGQPEGRRYRVEGEHEVRRSDGDDAQEERRDEGFVVSPHHHFVSDEAVGDQEYLARSANDGVRLVLVVVMVRVFPVLDALAELVPRRP